MKERSSECRLPRTGFRPTLYAPVFIQPHINFGQGTVVCCSTPRIIPCPDAACRYLLEQEMIVRVPFCCDALVKAGVPYIECSPSCFSPDFRC